jgi:hypothetical protein
MMILQLLVTAKINQLRIDGVVSNQYFFGTLKHHLSIVFKIVLSGFTNIAHIEAFKLLSEPNFIEHIPLLFIQVQYLSVDVGLTVEITSLNGHSHFVAIDGLDVCVGPSLIA